MMCSTDLQNMKLTAFQSSRNGINMVGLEVSLKWPNRCCADKTVTYKTVLKRRSLLKRLMYSRDEVIYQTQETVFHRDIQTPRRELKIRCAAEYFWWGVWIAHETLSRVFDISSQSKQKLRSKRRRKIVKIYVNYDRVSKPPSRLWFSLF